MRAGSSDLHELQAPKECCEQKKQSFPGRAHQLVTNTRQAALKMYKPETCTAWAGCILEYTYIAIIVEKGNMRQKENRTEIQDGLDVGEMEEK